MSDIHVLAGENGLLRAVYHVAVPSSLNSGGVTWQAALVNSGLATPSVMLPGSALGQIDATEAAALANGSLLEVIDDVLPDTAATAPLRLVYLRARYAQLTAAKLVELQARLKYFGFVTTKV